MNDFFIGLLQPIKGSVFLVLYPVYSIILFILIYIFFNRKSKDNANVNELSNISLAYLKGGLKSVIQLCLFSMYKNGLIKIRTEFISYFSRKGDKDKTLNEAESFIFDFLENEKTTSDFIYNKDFIKKFEKIIHSDILKLEENNYFRKGFSKIIPKLAIIISLFLIFYPPLLKFFIGIIRNKPVVFLMFEVVITAIVLLIFYSVISYKFKYTPKALKVLKETEKSLQWYSSELKNNRIPNNIDPLFAAAILGTGIFYSTDIYNEISSAVSPIDYSRNSGGNDSSSGCSSSSCSGSSCSSSSCGGGGCGGCGGGD